MLTPETKRHIDNARQVLVGKVPDPKSQIEQITNALIYKFMDDMDEAAAALGGNRKYFTGDYAKYSWKLLMAESLGAHERLALYRDAIESMSKNPSLPELFRSIFRNAFLPYNDARTLSLFLNEIDYFNYDNSEELGNGYEYLLSIMGSQGDAGQFRTPRHVIDFIVAAVDPTKDDSVLDPACGTAGFLISAYRHVVAKHDGKDDITGVIEQNTKELRLTADERKKLYKSYHGFDIDDNMVKMAKVNMYLHSFPEPNITVHDSLSSEDYWHERYDVILANPPFMSPKGGIEPHKKFGIQANRAEVLFVDYIASHLKPTGRAGIIVPEGVIFQSGKAYKELRKNLIDDYLYAVVSLPAGVFQPYSGVKTSILLLDKELAKQREGILFVKIENDGLSLGAQRRPITGDQMPEALRTLQDFRNNNEIVSDIAHVVSRKVIIESGEYILSGDRHKVNVISAHSEWPMVELGTILDYEQPQKYIVESTDYAETYKTPVLTAGKSFILGYTNETTGVFNASKLPVIIFDDFTTSSKLVDFTFKVKSSAMKILLPKEGVDVRYVYYVMQKLHFKPAEHKRFWISEYSKLKIPLPPIEIQRDTATELDGYQKIIDSAQTIVKTYKPTIKISSDWEIVKIAEISEFIRGITFSAKDKAENDDSAVLVATTKAAQEDGLRFNDLVPVSNDKVKKEKNYLRNGDLLISVANSANLLGRRTYVNNLDSSRKYSFGAFMACLRPNRKLILPEYMTVFFSENRYRQFCLARANTTTNISNLNWSDLSQFTIPLPPIEVQHEIVAYLKAEQKLIDANKKLIDHYDKKIQSKISEVWDE